MQKRLNSSQKLELFKTLKIGVLYGGSSSERAISIKSGQAIYKALKSLGYSVCCLNPARKKEFQNRLPTLDLAFIALHGTGGEDGQIQRVLEQKKIPYTGTGVSGSKRAFDKALSKAVFVKKKIPTPKFKIFSKPPHRSPFSRPMFVKPTSDGSSVGVFYIEDYDNNVDIVKKAFRLYKRLLFEEAIRGRELTVGIVGNKPLPVVEVVPKAQFYDYKAKYTKGMTRYVVPAKISAKLKQVLQKTALKTHQALGLRDFSRIDFMVDDKEKPFVLEANSIPGFTELSLLPKAAQNAGIRFPQLCEELVLLALARRG